jgi:hypothetical protein
MVHNLSLEIPYISNAKILRVFDTSVWNETILSTSVRLDIISPGFVQAKSFTVKRNFDKLYNCSSLNIYPVTNIKDLEEIPDGIYVIRLTNINGADEEFVEYNHLRQTQLLTKWYKALCKLNLNSCDTLTKDKNKIREHLYQIKSYIDAAKAKVEFCNAPNEGLDLHNYAVKLLDKFNNSCKNC